jgi:formylglycine-generating enzyme required for sulfatase activity
MFGNKISIDINSIISCFDGSHQWKISIMEGEPGWQRDLEWRNKKIRWHFENKQYEEALRDIDEFLSITGYDRAISKLKSTIHSCLDLLERIKHAKTHKDYKALPYYFRELYKLNPQDEESLKEKQFLDEVVLYLGKDIQGKCKFRVDCQDAIEEVSKLIKKSPQFYKDELAKTRAQLVNNLKELERKDKVEALNKEMKHALEQGEYDKALQSKMAANIDPIYDGELIFDQDKYKAVEAIHYKINQSLEKKNYQETLNLFKKLEKINPYYAWIKDQRKIFESYFSYSTAVQDSKGLHALHYIKESFLRERNQFHDFLIEALESLIAKKEYELEYKKKKKRKKVIASAVIAVLVLFFVYLGLGPIPYYLNKNKINRYLAEARVFLEKENFNELKIKLEMIFATREKLDEEKEIDGHINEILEKSFFIMTNRISSLEKSRKKDDAIENAEKEFLFFSSFPGEFSKAFQNKAETQLNRLKYDKYFNQGSYYYKTGQFQLAVENLEIAQKSISSTKVNELLKKARYEKHLEAGKRYHRQKNYTNALKEFRSAKQNISTYEVDRLISGVKKDAAIHELERKLEKFKKANDTENALLTLIDLKKTKNELYDTFDLLSQVSYRNPSGYSEVVLNNVTFVFIKGGEFEMGCFASADESLWRDALPLHKVALSDFWISKTEIAQSQYNGKKIRSNLPVTNIDWKNASLYAKGFGRRFNLKSGLPTEAQWEYAARNRGEKVIYPWGDFVSTSTANYKKYSNRVMPVASFPPNKLGIFDLAGNVREWCRDVYRKDYYSLSDLKDPCNGFGSGERVVRGGSFAENEIAMKTYFRYSRNENSKDNYTGFRIVLGK